MTKTPKKPSLTEGELKALIMARFNADQAKQVGLNERIKKALGEGGEQKPKDPEVSAIQCRFVDMTAGVVASRLKRRRRTGRPLFSHRDFAKFIPEISDKLIQSASCKLEPKDRKMAEKLVKGVMSNLFEMLSTAIPPRKDPYTEYWRWVTTVLDLARERGLPPIEYVASAGASDEVTRRLMTKAQYIAAAKRVMRKFMSVDGLKKLFLGLMFDALDADCDEEERHALSLEIERDFMPQLKPIVETSKSIFETWLGEETLRIYAAN